MEANIALTEKHASQQSPARIEELVRIFIHATKVSHAQAYAISKSS
jgi:hypothetical protein